jgi:hypothetical protein
MGFSGAIVRGSKDDLHILADERLSASEDLIKESQKALAFNFGECFADSRADTARSPISR